MVCYRDFFVDEMSQISLMWILNALLKIVYLF